MPMHANQWGNAKNTWRSQGASDKTRSWRASSPRLTTPRSISTIATTDQTTISYDPRQSKHIFTKININEPKTTDNIWIGTSHVFLPTFWCQKCNSWSSHHDQLHDERIRLQNNKNAQMAKMDEQHNTKKQNKTDTALHSSRPTIATTSISAQIAITIVIHTKTNDPEMIALDQTGVMATTPNRAVRAAQVAITTETVHTSRMIKRSTKHTQ
jgi:hypothetical protein